MSSDERPAISPGRARRFLVSMGILLLVVNLPLLASTLGSWRLSASGEQTTVELLDQTRRGDQWWVSYRLPADEDRDPRAWAERVDRATYEEAGRTGELRLTVLDGSNNHRVEGRVRDWTGTLLTLALDGLLLAVVALWWRSRRLAEQDDDA